MESHYTQGQALYSPQTRGADLMCRINNLESQWSRLEKRVEENKKKSLNAPGVLGVHNGQATARARPPLTVLSLLEPRRPVVEPGLSAEASTKEAEVVRLQQQVSQLQAQKDGLQDEVLTLAEKCSELRSKAEHSQRFLAPSTTVGAPAASLPRGWLWAAVITAVPPGGNRHLGGRDAPHHCSHMMVGAGCEDRGAATCCHMMGGPAVRTAVLP
ncbi:hypothetical protein CYMTET_24913 [Cymbomonas tetramitiformis]|uniref:Uncharacterized protein n=1 Tax=Cymbomonas tetramitiformis TaxID=36881 RepID=A0AAE0FWD5_9CHLO|nr:hypothetical protein CYMTET_24913 [Cymbomonas tetramitiformis]